MKRILLFVITLITFISYSAKEDVFGKWITEKSSSGNQIVVEIYEKNNKIYGKVIRLTDRFDASGNLRKDANNPDKSKQERTLEGIDFVYGFTYNPSNEYYENGNIYDPSSGKTYASYMKLEGTNKLMVRGHVKGLSFIGKTQYWKRVEN